MAPGQTSFLETTIGDVHARMRAGSVRGTELVQWYLDRIERYDRQGPKLTAIVNVNPEALRHAAELDQHLQRTGTLKGPLHGIPVLVKDQGETSFAPTTYGTKAYQDYRPAQNATVVQKLIDAGAVVLAKASMCDFAAGWFSFSSVTDRTRNPYALDRDAGGSSAGSGAGIAANLGLVGIGEDTGGSIRIPSSFNNLFGLRVTTGLISRFGFSPLVHFQDTPGPMARTVRDLARLLDVLVGYDPKDPFTAAATMAREAGSYEAMLEGFELRGCRVGLLKEGSGPDDDYSGPVNAVVRAVIAKLRSQGVETVEVSLPDVHDWIARTSLYVAQSKFDLNRFMAARNPPAPHTFKEIYDKRWFHPLNDLFHNLENGPERPQDAPDYYSNRLAQVEFQRALLNLYGLHQLDFLLYPDVKVLPPTYRDLESGTWSCLTFPTNTVIASQSHLPAMSIPAGFASGQLPVGLELVARPYAELSLLRFARAWERLSDPRRPPEL
jgi:Asp-tRNA(Asn)/Glu-tRNA(Gln) amidotransferase A subunit family amidase